MRRNSRAALALLAAGALVLSACGSDEEAAGFKACQITDTGGIDDRSFNQTVWDGFLRAQDELGAEVKYLESTSEADYEPNIQAFIDEGCDVIVSVGFALGDVTASFATANPDQAFAIVDYSYETPFENLQGIIFQTDEAAFLAGYAAAAMTETGVVGTWGGIPFPTVTVFMDGFLAGVNHHNAEKGTSVQVLGWDGTDGVFTNDFEAQDLGNAATADLLQNDADIILPVAGPAGLGAATAIQDFGSGKLIWVDTDGYFSTDYGSIILTSIEKKMDNAAFELIRSVQDGTFAGGNYVGTLANEGVGISPFHDFADQVPADLEAELEALSAAIVAGEVSVTP